MSDVTDPPRPEESSEAASVPSAEAAPEVVSEAAPPLLADSAPEFVGLGAPTEGIGAAPAAADPTGLPESAAQTTTATPAANEPAKPPPTAAEIDALRHRPSFLFFGVVAAVSLVADIGSKAWAEVALSRRTSLEPSISVIKDHLDFTLAYNRGGAWGLLHDANESIRRPFFLGVSVLAILFIVSLYSRLAPNQRSLKWGLPLVLGGALGNLSDRITRSSVVDFIDYHANWIERMNGLIAKYAKGWAVTDHWPTFNVADIFICIGVGLMAVDMVTSRRKAEPTLPPGAPPPPADVPTTTASGAS
jgi:signal peptidase II